VYLRFEKKDSMQNPKVVAAILFFCGIIMLGLFFTPFIHNVSGEIIHARITFVGRLLIGRFLLYIVILIAACIGVLKLGRLHNSR